MTLAAIAVRAPELEDVPEDPVGERAARARRLARRRCDVGEEALEDRVRRRRGAAAIAERAKPHELDAGGFEVGLPRAGALDLCYEIGDFQYSDWRLFI